MSYENILVEKEDAVLLITLNRPKAMNALSQALLAELLQALKEAEEDAQIKSIIIAGAEKFFCAGADISEVNKVTSPFSGYDYSQQFHRAFTEVERCKKPVIAAVRGLVLGGGLELMLSCDFQIVADDARVGVPEVNIGALPAGGGTVKLPRIMGAAKAKEMLLLGDPISGKEAEALGLVNKAVPADQVLAEARSLAAKLARKPPLVLQVIKAVVYNTEGMDLRTALDVEAQGLSILAASEDFVEGTSAFLQKRKPEFKGR